MPMDLTSTMQESADALIGNLMASEAFVCYQRANDRLITDSQACALLEQLSQAQVNVRQKQSGGVIQAEIDALRAIQEQVQRNHVIMYYVQTQQAAVNFLREINDEISQMLGINFASFAKPASTGGSSAGSGCCG